MREITTHKVNGCNVNLQILDLAPIASTGGRHHYQIVNVSRQNTGPDGDWVEVDLHFQDGPIAMVGTNGITHEALLAVLIDRLEGFQSGPYACDENAVALAHLSEALDVLHRRTLARVARGVEGTHAV